MRLRLHPVFALTVALLATLPVAAALARDSASQTPSAPTGSAASNPASAEDRIKSLGHIYTSAFCTRFVQHFNIAATVLNENDRHLDVADLGLSQIMDDYDRRDGVSRVYNDRVKLIATVGQMQRAIPVGQSAIDDLLAQARATADPKRQLALRESASQMQASIDRQRAVAYDLSNVVHVLLDKHTFEDTAEFNIARLMPPGSPPVRVDALDQPVEEPGSHFGAPSFKASGGTPSLQEVMQLGRQRWIIRAAETKASAAATRVLSTCDSEPAPPIKP